MTSYIYQQPASIRRFSTRKLYSRIVERVLGHDLLCGAVLWFAMIFILIRVYIWRIG